MDYALIIIIALFFLMVAAGTITMLCFLWKIRRELSANNLLLQNLNHRFSTDFHHQITKLDYILKNLKAIGSKVAPKMYKSTVKK